MQRTISEPVAEVLQGEIFDPKSHLAEDRDHSFEKSRTTSHDPRIPPVSFGC